MNRVKKFYFIIALLMVASLASVAILGSLLNDNIGKDPDTILISLPSLSSEDNDETQEQEIGILENVLIKNVDEIAIPTEPTITFGALWAGRKTAISKSVNTPPILNADWNTMPLKDAIDFAEFLIDTTIKYERFCDDIQTCGGDIDILVITKDEAFGKQHKIYCSTR